MRMDTSELTQPDAEPDSPSIPVWMPSQFKDDSELSETARRHKARKKARMRDDYAGRDFTLGEIIANSVSQGVAAALSIACIAILVVHAIGRGAGVYLVAALVFSIPMLVTFTMSTLYHALQAESAKRVFKVLDNSSTYVLIAGAFTPYCLITLGGAGGEALLVVEWVLAVAGIVIEAVWATRPRWIHGIGYGIMCAAFLAFMPALHASLPAAGFWLLVAALIALAISLLFRWFSSVRYLRFVFHVVATAGLICLFLSVALFVI